MFASSSNKEDEIKRQCNSVFPKGTELTLKILKGINLVAADVGGTSDPYVIITHSMHENDVRKTNIRFKTLNPTWGEEFRYTVNQENTTDILFNFVVMDYDRLTKDDFIGEASLLLNKLKCPESNKKYDFTLDLQNVKHGKLSLSLSIFEPTRTPTSPVSSLENNNDNNENLFIRTTKNRLSLKLKSTNTPSTPTDKKKFKMINDIDIRVPRDFRDIKVDEHDAVFEQSTNGKSSFLFISFMDCNLINDQQQQHEEEDIITNNSELQENKEENKKEEEKKYWDEIRQELMGAFLGNAISIISENVEVKDNFCNGLFNIVREYQWENKTDNILYNCVGYVIKPSDDRNLLGLFVYQSAKDNLVVVKEWLENLIKDCTLTKSNIEYL
ncbi:hypothetical protein ABK040_001229 [Willaertia magna]